MNSELLEALIRDFSNTIATLQLYDPDHPRVDLLIPKVVEGLRPLMLGEALTLVIAKDLILVQGKPLAKTPHSQRLTTLCGRQGIGFVSFLPGFAAADLRLLLRIICGLESLESATTGSLYLRVGGIDTPVDESPCHEIDSFEDLSEEELKGLVDMYDAVGEKAQLDTRQLTAIIAGFVAAFRREANPLFALVPLRMTDEYTFTHSVDVGILNIAQGMALGIEGQQLHDLGVAGMLHDVGKIFVDKEITTKPGKLTDAEWQAMRQHPSRGAQYLLNQEGIPRAAICSAYEHHMRYDLQGYPEAPEGWELNLASQMTMISDTFDALRTRRIYKDPWDFAKVSGHMLTLAGSQLNPDLTLNFLNTLARLGEGEGNYFSLDNLST